MNFVLGLIYIIVTGAVLFCMAALLLRGEETMANRIYLICQAMVVLWCSSQILQMTAETTGQLRAAYLIGNTGICFIGSSWYYFSKYYTGKTLTSVEKFFPLGISVFHFCMVLTNSLHGLYYSSFTTEEIKHGPVFYTNVAGTYLLVIAGSVIIYRNIGKTQLLARRLVIASVLIPVILNAAYLLGIVKSSFDITPLGFAVSIVLVMRATTKYRFMNLKRELAITNEKLLLEKERNRIAQQVHDTTGHTLTMIQSYMKLAEVAAGREDFNEVKGYLSEARSLTGNGIRELRESINMLRQETECEPVTQGVMQLADQVKEIPVEVTVRGEDSSRYSHLSKTIYDTVRESITNTLKYADASKMDIIIRFQNTSVEVIIGDDGKGCEKITENTGLSGIRERIEKAGGTVRFSSSKDEGFLTRIRLPL